LLNRALAAIAAMAIAMTVAPLSAHHSVAATFATDSLVTIEGIVSAVAWRNPHTRFVLDSVNADGETVSWNVEIGAPHALAQLGLTRDFLKVGDEVTLEVWTALDGTLNAHARIVQFADGERIELPEDRWMEQAELTAL
jgi:hypothetical protein